MGSIHSRFALYDPNPPKVVHLNPRIRRAFCAEKRWRQAPPDPMADAVPGWPWWLARTKVSRKRLYRLMYDQEVPCVFYERVGAIIQLPKDVPGKWQLKLQVDLRGRYKDDWDIDLALSDVGIYLEEEVPPPEESK